MASFWAGVEIPAQTPFFNKLELNNGVVIRRFHAFDLHIGRRLFIYFGVIGNLPEAGMAGDKNRSKTGRKQLEIMMILGFR